MNCHVHAICNDQTPTVPSSRLVLHADDLGMNRAVSEGILRGFRDGLLTSTSLLANAPDAGRALQQWKGLAADHAAGRLPSAAARAKAGRSRPPVRSGRPPESHAGPAAYRQPLSGRVARLGRPFSRRFRPVRPAATARPTGSARPFGRNWNEQVQVVCDHGLQPTHLNGHQYIEMIPAVTRGRGRSCWSVSASRWCAWRGNARCCARPCCAATSGNGRWPA